MKKICAMFRKIETRARESGKAKEAGCAAASGVMIKAAGLAWSFCRP